MPHGFAVESRGFACVARRQAGHGQPLPRAAVSSQAPWICRSPQSSSPSGKRSGPACRPPCRTTSGRRPQIDGHFEPHEIMEWHRILYRKGWAAPHWPVELRRPGPRRHAPLHPDRGARALGRAGAQPLRPDAWSARSSSSTAPRRRRSASCPRSSPATRCGARATPSPTPAATSPRSSVARRTTARDNFVVNGQKTWTTYAQYADWIFCLVRTDPAAKKQSGYQLPPHAT